jgi:serine/threonine protein kinase
MTPAVRLLTAAVWRDAGRPRPWPFQIGDSPLPGYRLVAARSKHADGSLWEAVGPGGTPVALRVFDLGHAVGAWDSFRAVCRLKAVSHPNLLPLTAVFLRDAAGNVAGDADPNTGGVRTALPKQLIAALPFAPHSLADRPGRGWPAHELVPHIQAAAAGLDCLNDPDGHGRPGADALVHCAVTPGNLVLRNGTAQVAHGFVCGVFLPPGREAADLGEQTAFVPAYAAPELIRGKPGRRTDQYSLAVTYYKVRTGRLPVDEAAAVTAHLLGDLDFGLVPPAEQAVLHRATSLDPADRFPNCRAFAAALAEAVAGGGEPTATFAPVSAGTLSFDPERHNVATATRTITGRPGGERPAFAPVLDRYTLVGHIGEGSFGTVFLAHPVGRPTDYVAVKFFVHGGPGRWDHLRAEVGRLADLDGVGGIVRLLDVAADAEHPYFVMPFAAGGSLGHRLKRGPLPAGEVPPLAVAMAETLAAVHARGVVHCDLKPGNVLLDGASRPVLADFGQAQLAGADAPALGTLFYMPAEQADPAARRPDPRWDVYAFGAVLYALVTGRPPHASPEARASLDSAGDLPGLLACYRQILATGRPGGHRGRCPAVEGVIDRCLCPDPAGRFPDAAAVLAALRA